MPIWVLTGFGPSIFSQTPSGESLPLNQPVERAIHGGETQSFTFNIKAGQYARVEVKQKGIDLVVSLFTSNDKVVGRMDGTEASVRHETVSCIAEEDGLFRVEIKAYGAVDHSGTYKATLLQLRESEIDDRSRLKTETSLLKDLDQARMLEDLPGESYCLVRLAGFYVTLGEFETSDEYLKESAKITSKIRDKAVLFQAAEDFFQLSFDLNISSRMQERVLILSQAVNLYELAQNNPGVAKALANIGLVYADHGELQKSLEFYLKALPLLKLPSLARDRGATLSNIGTAYADLGDKQAALRYYGLALPIQRTKDRLGAATTLNNIGLVYSDLGNWKRSLLFLEDSLRILIEVEKVKIIEYRTIRTRVRYRRYRRAKQK